MSAAKTDEEIIKSKRNISRFFVEQRHISWVMVLALVIALVPLALRGGPLWEPMCYAQMGGMLCATFITLLLVPVIYSIFVLDLKLIKWEAAGTPSEDQQPEAAGDHDGDAAPVTVKT